MRRVANSLLLLLSLCTPVFGQPAAKPDFRAYSRKELVECFDHLELCKAENIDQIDNELRARLPSMNSEDLMRCFSDWHICGVGGDGGEWEVAEVLRRRGEMGTLFRKFGNTSSWETLSGLERVAYDSKSPAAANFMRSVFTRRRDDGENLYWPAMYLAKSCDVGALRYLNPGQNSKSIADKFSVSSLQFSSTVELFGKCHYRPAIPYLVQIGLHAASLNLGEAAEKSLEKLYPDPPKFESLAAVQMYFCKRANQDGFSLHCSTDS